jgi:RHS repeat-associated protein
MVALNKTYLKTLTPDRSAKDSGHRYYSPEISRWLSRDPIGEDGAVNLYGFTHNDPIRRVDQDGRIDVATPFYTVLSQVDVQGWYCKDSFPWQGQNQATLDELRMWVFVSSQYIPPGSWQTLLSSEGRCKCKGDCWHCRRETRCYQSMNYGVLWPGGMPWYSSFQVLWESYKFDDKNGQELYTEVEEQVGAQGVQALGSPQAVCNHWCSSLSHTDWDNL